jgi:Domain of unknown function (DUF4082)
MGRSAACALVIVMLGAGVAGAQSGPTFAAGSNLARGRPYTLSPRPNYSLTTDTGDDTQLTDGVYTTWNPIWMQASTVGWSGASPVTIVIDLQSVQPIAGVSYSTAAGKAGVTWPRSVFVLTSDDGQRYFPAGDLVPLGPGGAGPPAAGYAAFRYVTRSLHTHGRYVALIVDTFGPFAFSDEIEVLAGDAASLASPLTGTPTTDLSQFFAAAHMARQIQRRMSADVDAARAALAAAVVAGDVRSALAGELNDIDAGIQTLPAAAPGFRAVLPLNDLHASLFAVQGALAEATGWPALTAWAVNPWDFAQPLDKSPALGSERVSIAAMNGETRSGAISVSNSTSQPLTASVQLEASDGSEPADVSLFQTAWTDTRELIPVADALLPLPADGAPIVLPAGMTQQIWLRFSPSGRPPGRYAGSVQIVTDEGPSSRVPFELMVLAGQFPAQLTMHSGGFDYTDANRGLGVTPNNRDALVQQLQAQNVDTPWAHGTVVPVGAFDALGRATTTPDTSAFDSWIARWPGARRYGIFLNVGDTIAGIRSSDARFAGAVAQWITFWVGHAAARGVEASRLVLLLVDEPQSAAQDARVVAWARAIKAAAPAVTIWEDPIYPDPVAAAPASLAVTDVLSVERGMMASQGASFVDFYRQRGRTGQVLDVYGSSGPARLLDPYTYDRLQAWVAVDLGATSSTFWSYADDASGHSWNEYATTAAPYSPFFLSDSSVTISKHSEAMREGIEDVEYLMMLRTQVAQAPQGDPRGLAANATARVLQASGSSNFQWTANKDRSIADDVRLMIAREVTGGPSVVPAPDPAPAPQASAACPCSIWNSTAQPSRIEVTDGQPNELGMQFRSAVNGTVTAIRFYKGVTNTGPHFGHLWTSNGRLLATVAFTNESASGWQEARLTTPVAIAAGAVYVVSYYTSTGNYAVDDDFFSGGAVDRGPLHALSSDESPGGNGVYLYGPSGFPMETYLGSNYWVDVVMTAP